MNNFYAQIISQQGRFLLVKCSLKSTFLNHPKTADELRACFPVMAQLRTTLTEDKFFTQVSIQQKEGYQLAYIQVDGAIVAVAGFRIMHNLAYEKFLYVDDLVTGG